MFARAIVHRVFRSQANLIVCPRFLIWRRAFLTNRQRNGQSVVFSKTQEESKLLISVLRSFDPRKAHVAESSILNVSIRSRRSDSQYSSDMECRFRLERSFNHRDIQRCDGQQSGLGHHSHDPCGPYDRVWGKSPAKQLIIPINDTIRIYC